MNKLNLRLLGSFLIIPVLVQVFFSVANIFLQGSIKFPSLLQILKESEKLYLEPSFLSALAGTMFSVTLAMVAGVLGGTIFGFILGANNSVWGLSQPSVDFFRSIPVTFLIPGLAILLGTSSPHIIWAAAAYPVSLIMLINTRAGIAAQSRIRVHSYKLMVGRWSQPEIWSKITIFEALPYLAIGIRISLSYTIVIVTVLEFMHLGNYQGIGALVNDEMQNFNYAKVYALIAILGTMGFLTNKGLELLQEKFLHWGASADRGADR